MAFIKSKKRWPPKIGVTITKAKPMHKGHELMIAMAAAELDELTVIVSDNEEHYSEWPLQYRYKMVQQALAKYTNVRVVKHYDCSPKADSYDEHGTAVGEAFWDYWVDTFRLLVPDATYFVSSDQYGQEAARRLTTKENYVQWFPVDPDRELVPVSATKIRNDPIKYWKYIVPEFRQRIGKRVLVIGPESTGKSTLTKDLGKAWNSPVVPEYGRILSEAKDNELNEKDFLDIVKRHHEMELFAMRNSETGIAISDTDIWTTYLFSEIYLEGSLDELKIKHNPSWYDLVVLLPPTIPWDDDGTRVMPSQKDREEFFEKLRAGYETRFGRHKNFMVLEETDRKRRVEIVSMAIAAMLGQDEKDKSDAFNRLTNQGASLIV